MPLPLKGNLSKNGGALLEGHHAGWNCWSRGGAETTVAVKVTGCPLLDGFGDELTVAVDALAWTFWTRVALPPLKLPSPL